MFALIGPREDKKQYRNRIRLTGNEKLISTTNLVDSIGTKIAVTQITYRYADIKFLPEALLPLTHIGLDKLSELRY